MKPEDLTSNAAHVRKAVRDAAAAVLSYPRSSLNPYNVEAWSDAIAERVAAELAAPASAPVLSAEDRAAAERFVAWAVNDLEAADDPQWDEHQAGAAVVRRLLGGER